MFVVELRCLRAAALLIRFFVVTAEVPTNCRPSGIADMTICRQSGERIGTVSSISSRLDGKIGSVTAEQKKPRFVEKWLCKQRLGPAFAGLTRPIDGRIKPTQFNVPLVEEFWA